MAHPHTGAPADYEPLLTLIGNARFVLLGEASHSTHEFYRERAQITQHPIQEKGFTAVAIAADWPDAYRKMFEVTTLYHHTYCSPYLPLASSPARRWRPLRQGASQSERFLSFRNSLRVIDVFASCRGERIHRFVKLAQ